MSTKRTFILLIITGLLVLNSIALAIYLYLSPAPRNKGAAVSTAVISNDKASVKAQRIIATKSTILSDEYYSIHFNYSDAVEVCKLEAQAKNSNLIQLSVDDLSSRFNIKDKMYLIKLDSQVGTPLLYDQKQHICHINPKTQGVAYYHEVTRRVAIRSN